MIFSVPESLPAQWQKMGDPYFLYFYFCRAIACLFLFISFSYACDRIIAYVTSLIKEAMFFMMNCLKFTFLESF
jgi:hypothetical protein